MTTFKIIDHDCETDPAAVNVRECKVDAPSSAHALAEYFGITVEGMLAIAKADGIEPTDTMWRIERTWDGRVVREVGAVALIKENA